MYAFDLIHLNFENLFLHFPSTGHSKFLLYLRYILIFSKFMFFASDLYFYFCYFRTTLTDILKRIVTDFRQGGHKIVELFQNRNGSVVNCNVIGSR